jgi:RNA polymerase sigma-70 factor (ECF subfamily)
MASVDEYDLVVATLRGDTEAFEQLVQKYEKPVYNLAYRMLNRRTDAEDIAQEAFCRAFTKLDSFDLGRSFKNWILAITSNLCIDQLRRKKAVYLEDANYASWMSDGGASPERQAIQEEQERQVQELLDLLPPKYRQVIILRYWNELSYAEIAETTGLPLGTVKTRLYRARNLLTEKAQAQTAVLQPVLWPISATSISG